MNRLLALLIGLLFAGFSGCVATPSEEAESHDEGEHDEEASGEASEEEASGEEEPAESNETEEAPNTAPEANLTADVTNGSVPLNVTFGLAGEDADGDNLTWTLDADGDGAVDANGSELPATFTFSYTEAGTYTAVLNVTDGESSAEANLTIQAEAVLLAGPLICSRTPTLSAGPVYEFDGDGGTWVFLEDNGMAGLQVGNTHPLGSLDENPAWVDCENGDLMLF